MKRIDLVTQIKSEQMHPIQWDVRSEPYTILIRIYKPFEYAEHLKFTPF